MKNLQDLSGRHAVITGGARGLGHAIATTLADAGARITVIDIQPALSAANLSSQWNPIELDISHPNSLQSQRQLASELGAIDIVVANAGIVPPWRGVADLDGDEWARVMAVNSWGIAATLGGFAPALAASRHASVIVMASINAYRAHPQQVLYTASKHAVVGIVRAAALDLGPQGIRVNALAPGPVATAALKNRVHDRHSSGGPEAETAFAALRADTALGRLASSEDVATTALWLASDASASATGIVLPVEAGLA